MAANAKLESASDFAYRLATLGNATQRQRHRDQIEFAKRASDLALVRAVLAWARGPGRRVVTSDGETVLDYAFDPSRVLEEITSA